MHKHENPRNVRCPACGAAPTYGCHTTTLFVPTGTHSARWKKIGIPHPTMQLQMEVGVAGCFVDRGRLRNIPGATKLMLGL